jgi:hypothetical protein
LEGSEHVSLAVVTTTAVLESDRHGDHDVKAEGCEEESTASMMSFSSVFNAAYDLEWGKTSPLKVSATRHTSTSEDVDCEAEMACLRLSHVRQHEAGILIVLAPQRKPDANRETGGGQLWFRYFLYAGNPSFGFDGFGVVSDFLRDARDCHSEKACEERYGRCSRQEPGPCYAVQTRCVERTEYLTICDEVVLLSVWEVDIVSAMFGLSELIVAARTRGQAGVSERLAQQAKVVDAMRRLESTCWR